MINLNLRNNLQVNFAARKGPALDMAVNEAREAYKTFKEQSSNDTKNEFIKKLDIVKKYTTLTPVEKQLRKIRGENPLLRTLTEAVKLYGHNDFSESMAKINWLFQKGSNVHRKNIHEVDALSYALNSGFHHENKLRINNNISLVETLLKKGAKIEQHHLTQYPYYWKNEDVLTLLAKKADIKVLESAVQKIEHDNKTFCNSQFLWEQGNELLKNIYESRKKK